MNKVPAQEIVVKKIDPTSLCLYCEGWKERYDDLHKKYDLLKQSSEYQRKTIFVLEDHLDLIKYGLNRPRFTKETDGDYR